MQHLAILQRSLYLHMRTLRSCRAQILHLASGMVIFLVALAEVVC